MIITCEQCQTQFQLDDSRIPERGARVRCSRCKHAFFVKPGAEAGDPVERAAEQALAEDEEQRAGSTQELGPGSSLRGEADEESDWEFNDARPDPDSGLAAAREAVDDLLGPVGEAPSGETNEGLLDARSDVDQGIDSLLESGGSGRDLLDLDRPDLRAEEPAVEEPGVAHAEPETAAPPVAEEPTGPPPLQAEARAADEELGSPENWEFFADEQEDAISREADPEQRPTRETPLGPQPRLQRPPIDVNAEPSKTLQRLRQVAHAAGWLSVVLLLLGGLHGGVVSQRGQSLAPRAAQSAGGLEATAVEGRWLDNAVAGPIYVISGKLVRAGSSPVVPSAWLAVRLFDDDGVMLEEQAAAAGPALPEPLLREGDPRALRAVQAQGALAMAGAPLVPGDAWAFQAILTHLPEAASRFDLAAIRVEPPPAEPSPAPPQSAAPQAETPEDEIPEGSV